MAPADLDFGVFFDLAPTGAALYAPLYDEQGELVDFRFFRLNPAGQRLLGLPAQPPRTFREYYLNSVPTGIFDQYRTAYLTGQASTYDAPYAGDGIETFSAWWPSAAARCWSSTSPTWPTYPGRRPNRPCATAAPVSRQPVPRPNASGVSCR